MKPELMERLNQINREFYSAFAAPFSETRKSLRELQVILPYIADGARVLDVGCGNGRVAALLARHRHGTEYLGVDASEELVARCRTHVAGRMSQVTEFVVADISQPEWVSSLPLSNDLGSTEELFPVGRMPGAGAFDCVLMLALLHHIPGRQVRARIVRQVRELLAPRGYLIISTWQFMDNARMLKRIVPWNKVGIDEQELEPGDALLSWKRGGTGLRYCHWIEEDELHSLATLAGLSIVKTFRAGGREGNLSLYSVLSA
jgi:SAM-dependent methyltransferase